MDGDAALTEQLPRHELQEDRSPGQQDMMMETEDRSFEREDVSLQEDRSFEQEDMMMEIEDQEQSNGDMNFMFDGLLAAIKRRIGKE